MKVSIRLLIGVSGMAMASALVVPVATAQVALVPPPPHAKAPFLRNAQSPANEFVLPAADDTASAAAASPAAPAAGGFWTAVTTSPAVSLGNPLLLTDGTVIVADVDTPNWYKLTPDSHGNYATGTWTPIASLPVIDGTQYAPLYHASGVLPDGRVIIMGGEYNGSNTEVWTNLGAIYDPVANTWTAVSAPSSWAANTIGDSQSVVLADGTFMLGGCCNSPDADALLNPTTLTWTSTGAPNAGALYQDEQGYELLPNGNVLTLDIWTNYTTSGNATNAEQYVPASGVWIGAGNTPVSLPDPYVCGNFEIGPAVMRPNGTLVAFGGDTGCAAAALKTDPTAIFDASSGTWNTGPSVPSRCGISGTRPCDLADAPAAMLPNGNILFGASSGYGNRPTHFFEYTARNVIQQVADPLENSNRLGAYNYDFLVLPNGQVLSTDFSPNAEVYTPTTLAIPSWAPTIGSYPKVVTHGDSYPISGTQFAGLTQGAYYGDDVQGATNYPLVRITNRATGHVFFARTANHSTMSIASGTAGSTTFTVPASIETGASTLAVIANGIASKGVIVIVR